MMLSQNKTRRGKVGFLQEFAHKELERAGLFDPDSDYNGWVGHSVMELIHTLENRGQSGVSMEMILELFTTLARYEPLSPLTGEDDEWVEINYPECPSRLWQNKRCLTVFKDETGAYNSQGRIFRYKNGGHGIRGVDSRVSITFPYTPVVEYVDVEE